MGKSGPSGKLGLVEIPWVEGLKALGELAALCATCSCRHCPGSDNPFALSPSTVNRVIFCTPSAWGFVDNVEGPEFHV